MKNEPLKFFDFRVGDGFELCSADWTFSSLKSAHLVLDGVCEIAADRFLSPIKKCIHATSSSAFLVVKPWQPGGKKLQHALTAKIPGLTEVDGVLFAPVGLCDLTAVFDIRHISGGGDSGEWILGGSEQNSITEKIFSCSESPLVSLLKQSNRIRCLASFSEHRQILFMTKIYPGVDAAISEIREIAAGRL